MGNINFLKFFIANSIILRNLDAWLLVCRLWGFVNTGRSRMYLGERSQNVSGKASAGRRHYVICKALADRQFSDVSCRRPIFMRGG